MNAAAPILLDCTRMVATRWTGRMPSGIDRVCDAYRANFAARAQAVMQVRGHARVLSSSQSARLFDLLEGPVDAFRYGFANLAARVLATAPLGPRVTTQNARPLYINVSHSDFDLDRHLGWVRASMVRPVYFLHDLIPIEYPHFTTAHKAARHAGRVRRALEAATGIIANSQDTARAIRAFAARQGLSTPPLLAAPLGATSLPKPDLHRDPSRASFVCLSTIEHRKNHMMLLDVWQRLIASEGERAPRLTLVGRWGVGGEAVHQRYRSDPQLHRFVTIHTRCCDAEIAQHLLGAHALLAPSRAEGYGLPVVEALRFGVPVIASDLPTFREVGGSVPTYLDPDASEAWVRMVREFAASGPERKRQVAALRAWHAPNWRDHFAQVDAWLENLVRPRAIASHHFNNKDRFDEPCLGQLCAGRLQ